MENTRAAKGESASSFAAGASAKKKIRGRMISLFIVVCHLFGILSAIHAVMSTRTPQGAVAWSVSLVTFPYVAVPAYWVLGRSRFQGYVTARHGQLEGFSEVSKEASAKMIDFRIDPEFMPPAGRAAERLAGIPFSTGNECELLVDGDATFASIIEGIDAAEEYILFQFYIVHDDQIGRKLQSHLIEKAKAGVAVYFLYDEIGSSSLPKSYLGKLREAGVQVHEFHTQKGAGNRFQINFRNHRKVVVVDGKVTWIGGHNVGDEYLSRNPKFGHWRDTHVKIQGPAVLGAQLSFAEDWYWATGMSPKLNWTPVAAEGANVPVLVIPSGPADALETANLMFVHAINSAKERIWIASPYFVPDQPVIVALQLAGLRGVDVRILIPENPDQMAVALSAYSYVEEVGRTGARIYRYQDGFLHEKVMLIDRSASTIGTANFDNRSFRLNFEITAMIVDEDFASQMESMFEEDFSKSRLMTSSELEEKGWWFRFSVRVARLMAPIQ